MPTLKQRLEGREEGGEEGREEGKEVETETEKEEVMRLNSSMVTMMRLMLHHPRVLFLLRKVTHTLKYSPLSTASSVSLATAASINLATLPC